MKKLLFLYVFTILFTGFAGADTVLTNWAVKLKNPLPSVVKSEYGGPVVHKDRILLTMRDGRFVVFNHGGKLLFSEDKGSEILFPPYLTDEGILVFTSDAIYLLDDKDYSTLWSSKIKYPAVSPPLITDDGFLVRLYNNSLYLFDKKNGEMTGNYTSYTESDMPYIKQSQPFISDNMIVTGFPDGLIVYFKLETEDENGSKIVPYYKIKVHDTLFTGGRKKFHDVFAIVPVRDNIVFSTGESGGVLVDLEKIDRKELKNRHLKLYGESSIIGYGEGGAAIYDSSGIKKREIFRTANFTATCTESDDFYIFAEKGSSPFFFENDKKVRVYDKALENEIFSMTINSGVSGNIAVEDNNFYLLSDHGILYSFSLHKKK